MPIQFPQGLDLTGGAGVISDEMRKKAERDRILEGFRRFRDTTNPLTTIPAPTGSYEPLTRPGTSSSWQLDPTALGQQGAMGPPNPNDLLQPTPMPRIAPPRQPMTMRGTPTQERRPMDPNSPEYQAAEGEFMSLGPQAESMLTAVQNLSKQYQPKLDEVSPGATVISSKLNPQTNQRDVNKVMTAEQRQLPFKLVKSNRVQEDGPHTIVSAYDLQGNYMGEHDLGIDADAVTRAKRAQTLGAGLLTPDAVDVMAKDMLVSGRAPSMGMGGAAARIQVYNRYAQLAHENGIDEQARQVMQNVTQSEAKNLSKVIQQRSQVLAFEKTAKQNLDYALAKSNMVDRFDAPVFNRWKLWAQRNLAGDTSAPPDEGVAAFEAAAHVAANEIAKVTATTTGNLVPQQEREEYRKLLDTALNVQQFKSVADVLRQDMDNRQIAYDREIEEIRNAFPTIAQFQTTLGKPTGAPSPTGQPAPQRNTIPAPPGKKVPKFQFED